MYKKFILFFALAFSGCSSEAPAPGAQRIVSLGGDVTEIVYALGAGDRVVATDSTSVYPQAAAETQKVGYVRRLSAEGVLATEPELILVSGAAGPEEAIEQIRAVGIELVEMPTEYSIDGILEKVRIVAEAVGEVERGEELVAEIEADWAAAQSEIAKFDAPPRAFFYTALRDGIPQAAGTETAGHGVIDLLGGENLFASQSGYTPISNEAAVAADPDMIFVMSHEVASTGGVETIKANPAIALTNAVSEGRIFEVDSVQVMQFGPRTAEAVVDLARAINGAEASSDGPAQSGG